MRKFSAWGIVGTLTLGLTVAATAAADSDADQGDAKTAPSASPSSPNPFGRWFSPRKVQDKQPPVKADQRAAKATDSGNKPASQVDQAAAEQAREQAVLFRRLAVCNKLMEIAVQTNDNDLMRRAEQLDERAWTAYGQRTGFVHGNGGTSAADGETLSRHLGPPSADKTSGARAALREVNP